MTQSCLGGKHTNEFVFLIDCPVDAAHNCCTNDWHALKCGVLDKHIR